MSDPDELWALLRDGCDETEQPDEDDFAHDESDDFNFGEFGETEKQLEPERIKPEIWQWIRDRQEEGYRSYSHYPGYFTLSLKKVAPVGKYLPLDPAELERHAAKINTGYYGVSKWL